MGTLGRSADISRDTLTGTLDDVAEHVVAQLVTQHQHAFDGEA